MKKATHTYSLVAIFITAVVMSSCGILDSPTSPSKEANCVFTKHDVTGTSTTVVGGSTTYKIYHTTTVKNTGTSTARDVKIVVYVNGSSKGSIDVTGSLSPGQNINKDFQTITVGAKPELRLWWE